MRCSLPKKTLANASRLAVAASEAKASQPALASVLIVASNDRLTFTGTDLMVGASVVVPCSVSKSGAALVNAKQFAGAINGLADGEVSLELDGANFIMRSGKSRQRIASGMAEDFPSVPHADGASLFPVRASLLLEVISAVMPMVCDDDARPHLACVLVEIVGGTLRAVATDGHTLAKREAKYDGSLGQILIPRVSLGDVKRALESVTGGVEIGVRLGYLFLVADGIEVSVKLTQEVFPPYQKVIPSTKKRTAIMSRVAAMEAIGRAVANMPNTTTSVFDFDDGTLTVRAQSTEAEASDGLDIDYAAGPFRIAGCANYIVRAMAAIAQDEVEIETSGELDPIVLRGRDSTESVHVVMPVRM